MTPVFGRRILGFVVTLAIGLLPVVPAEHVHEVEEHGHLELLVHRHLQGHDLTATHHQSTIDHDDAPIATVDQDYVVPSSWHLDAADQPGAIAVLLPPIPSRLAYSAFVERLIHGPPRGPTPDRGPPSILPS